LAVTGGRGPNNATEMAIQLALVVETDERRDLARPNAAMKQ
jgi:hypothetical protein